MFDFEENLIDEFDEEMDWVNAEENAVVNAEEMPDEQESIFSGLPEEVRSSLTPAHLRAVFPHMHA